MREARPRLTESLVKLARHRYRATNIAPFTIGLVASGSQNWVYLALGLVNVNLYGVILEYANTISDRVEDSIDYPDRTAMARRVGYRRLHHLVAGLSIVYLANIGLMMALASLRPIIATVWLFTLLFALAYSYGPKMKARTVGSPFVNSLVMPAFLVLGWRAEGDLSVYPYVVLLFVAKASCAVLGYKDLPNLEGDAAIGYRSLLLRMVRGRGAFPKAVFVSLLPYAALLAFGFTGAINSQYPIVLAATPFALGFVLFLGRASTLADRYAVREYVNVYLVVLMAMLMYVLHPVALSLWFALGAVLWFFMFTWYGHPEPGLLTADTARRLIALLRERPAQPWSENLDTAEHRPVIGST